MSVAGVSGFGSSPPERTTSPPSATTCRTPMLRFTVRAECSCWLSVTTGSRPSRGSVTRACSAAWAYPGPCRATRHLATGGDAGTRLLVEMSLPVGGDAPIRSGHGLFERMMGRRRQRRIRTRTRRCDSRRTSLHLVQSLRRWRGLTRERDSLRAGRRRIAASDVAAFRATAQMEPPAARRVAFDTTRTARLLRRIDHLIVHVASSLSVPSIWPAKYRPQVPDRPAAKRGSAVGIGCPSG